MRAPFFPLFLRLKQHLAEDSIGDIGFVRAGCSIADVPPDHPSFSLRNMAGALPEHRHLRGVPGRLLPRPQQSACKRSAGWEAPASTSSPVLTSATKAALLRSSGARSWSVERRLYRRHGWECHHPTRTGWNPSRLRLFGMWMDGRSNCTCRLRRRAKLRNHPLLFVDTFRRY